MNWKKVALYSLIGLVTLPTVTIGSSLTASLIQGKEPAEAVQILGEQIDTILSRLSIAEVKQAELEEALSNVENTVASTSDAQKATESGLEGATEEINRLRTEIELGKEQDAYEASQEELAQHCEDLEWAKGMPGKITIDKAYLGALSRSKPDTFLLQLEDDYKSELNDLLNTNVPYYSDYSDPDRIAYCESREWCDEDETACAVMLPEHQHPETRKCNATLNIYEESEELKSWYEGEKSRLSNPNAEEYQKQQATADRLKPQYDEYMAKCQ